MRYTGGAQEGLTWLLAFLAVSGGALVWAMLVGWWKDLARAYRFDEAIEAERQAAFLGRTRRIRQGERGEPVTGDPSA